MPNVLIKLIPHLSYSIITFFLILDRDSAVEIVCRVIHRWARDDGDDASVGHALYHTQSPCAGDLDIHSINYINAVIIIP